MSLPQKFRDWLEEESRLWTQEGLIDETQRGRLLARYPEQETGGRMAFVLRTLGVVVLFASLLLVISHNWDGLGRGGRMGAVTGVLVLLQGIALAYFLKGRTSGSLLGHLASCLGFGAAIAMTGQVYHLDAHAPDAVLTWALLTLPFALLLRSSLLHYLYLILAGIWYGMEAGPRTGWGVHGAALAYAAMIAPSAWVAYFRRSVNRTGIAVFAVSDLAMVGVVALSAGLLLALLCADARSLPAAALSLPLALAALHLQGDPRARPWRFLGMVLLAGQFLALGDFDDVVTRVNLARFREFLPWHTMPWLSYPAAGIVLLALFLRRRGQGRAEALLAAGGIALGILPHLGLPDAVTQSLLVSLANVATLAMAVYLLQLGLAEGRLRPYVYGAALFFVWLGWRYSDVHEALGYLGMAAIFAVIGIGLFALAKVWRDRRAERVTERLPELAADPLARPADWLLARALTLVVATHLAQLAVIGWMAWHHGEPLRGGRRFLVRCEPVDPRDWMRGDYVILSYAFSDEQGEELDAVAKELGGRSNMPPEDTVVYLPLKLDQSGYAVRAGAVGLRPPTEGPFLKGRTDGYYTSRMRFGIEAFFVPEGEGRKWEDLRQHGDLIAEIAVLPDGRAGLVDIRKDPAPRKPVSVRVLRGWQLERSAWQGYVIDNADAFERATSPMRPDADKPDFSRERVVAKSYASAAQVAAATDNGTAVRITLRTNGERLEAREDLLIALPRGDQPIRIDGQLVEPSR